MVLGVGSRERHVVPLVEARAIESMSRIPQRKSAFLNRGEVRGSQDSKERRRWQAIRA